MATSGPLEILDKLTDQPSSYLFNTAPPPYRSNAARQIGTGFKGKTHLSPMLYHTEAGVVFYDRVVTGAQETRMLQKLTKPKELRPANSCISNVVLSGGAGAPAITSPGHSPPGSPARARHTASARSWPTARLPHHCHTSGGGVEATASLGSCSPAQTGHQGAGTSGHGNAGRAAQASDTRKRYTASLRSRSDVELEMASKYFHQQRATMTATHVFTWGGRLNHGSQLGGGGRGPAAAKAAAAAGLTPVGGLFSGDTHRAPLRLDAYQE